MKTDQEIRAAIETCKRDFISLGREIIEVSSDLIAIARSVRDSAQIVKRGPLVEFKRAPDSTTAIAGYASTFNFVDNGNDTVVPGAFAETLAKHREAGTRPVMLWAHNQDEPIGVWDEMTEDAHGLFVKGRVLKSVRRGAEALDLIAGGAVNSLSIGYRVLRDEIDSKTGVRRLLRLQLFEISVVSIPMNRQAVLTGKEYELSEVRRAVTALSRTAESFSVAVR